MDIFLQMHLRIPGCMGTKYSVEYDLKQLQTDTRLQRAAYMFHLAKFYKCVQTYGLES